MQPLTCELCGSNDIIKQDGLFVCQHCGTKYTLEEAKKMLDSVRIDRSDDLKKYLELADACQENGDNKNAAKYYSLALEIEPNNPFTYFELSKAQYFDYFFSSANVSCLPKIALKMQSAFCTTIDMFLI